MLETRCGHLHSPLNISNQARETCRAGAVIPFHRRRNRGSKKQTNFIQPIWFLSRRGRIGAQVVLGPLCDSRRLSEGGWGRGGEFVDV